MVSSSLLLRLTNLLSNPLQVLGHALLLGGGALGHLLQGRLRWGATLQQAQRVGVASIPMVLLLATIGGGVLALQLCRVFGNSGTEAYIGGVVALTVVREIAPVFTALAVATRCATAMASELAYMQTTQQVDAMTMLQVSPVRYLVLPRVLATLWVVPCLSVLAAVVAIGSGMVVARWVLGLHYALYVHSIWTILPPRDLVVAGVKALCFAGLISLSACAIGLGTRGGSQQVGLAAMRTAVASCMLILLADFFLSWCFLEPLT